jgi:hypothetical protein
VTMISIFTLNSAQIIPFFICFNHLVCKAPVQTVNLNIKLSEPQDTNICRQFHDQINGTLQNFEFFIFEFVNDEFNLLVTAS